MDLRDRRLDRRLGRSLINRILLAVNVLFKPSYEIKQAQNPLVLRQSAPYSAIVTRKSN